MSNFLLNFKQSYMVVPIAIVFSILLVFIDSKVNKKSVDSKTYFKIALLSGLIALFAVYVNTLKGHVTEEILTGTAPF